MRKAKEKDGLQRKEKGESMKTVIVKKTDQKKFEGLIRQFLLHGWRVLVR